MTENAEKPDAAVANTPDEKDHYPHGDNGKQASAHEDNKSQQMKSDVPPGLPEEKTPERKELNHHLEKAAAHKKEKQLEHINQIEDPTLTQKRITVDAVISSTSTAYTVPSVIDAVTKEKDQDTQHVSRDLKKADSANLSFIAVSDDTKANRIRRLFKPAKVRKMEIKKSRVIYSIRVRPQVFALERRGNQIVDEKGYEYKALDLYIASDEQITFRPSQVIRIKGIPLPHPKTQKTTLLAYNVTFPESVLAFDITRLQELKTKFEDKTVSERFNWILENFELYAHIYGRKNLAGAGFLTYFSPIYIVFGGEQQRGWIICNVIGDTTCAKSETARKLTRLLGAGMMITAELASVAGLTGTATQIEREGWFVDWGFLVLTDQGLLTIDGAHKLSPACWASIAEAERTGIVTIAKAAKNTTYARTRQLRICNAVDRETGTYSTKSLSAFLYPIQALPTILDKTSIARNDLVAFADVRDVTPEMINQYNNKDYDHDIEKLAEVRKWCWSNKTKVEWTEEAEKFLLQKATELYNQFYCESIPIVSSDMKWKLARLSISMAYLTLSTNDDFSVLKVTKDHVEEVVKFLTEQYNAAGLNVLAQAMKYEKLTIEDVKDLFLIINGQLKQPLDNLAEILTSIVIDGRTTNDQLKTRFNLSEKSQLRPLISTLQTEKLIVSKRGFYPTAKLNEAYNVTEGFAVVATLADPKLDTPNALHNNQKQKINVNEKQQITLKHNPEKIGLGGFYCDGGKQGKYGKNSENGCESKHHVHEGQGQKEKPVLNVYRVFNGEPCSCGEFAVEYELHNTTENTRKSYCASCVKKEKKWFLEHGYDIVYPSSRSEMGA